MIANPERFRSHRAWLPEESDATLADPARHPGDGSGDPLVVDKTASCRFDQLVLGTPDHVKTLTSPPAIAVRSSTAPS
jgi:hypothetical protein